MHILGFIRLKHMNLFDCVFDDICDPKRLLEMSTEFPTVSLDITWPNYRSLKPNIETYNRNPIAADTRGGDPMADP